MPTRSDCVKSSIAVCEFWYMCSNYDIRTLNQRIETLWYNVERHIDLMEEAEVQENEYEASRHMDLILDYTLRIQAEMHALHIHA